VTASTDRLPRRWRVVLLVSNALLVLGALIFTSPWTSGAYTWLVQQRLQAEVARPAPAPAPVVKSSPKRAKAADPVWDGWDREDARAWSRAAEGAGLGRLVIPRIGLDAALVKGASDADLRSGPGWVIGTAVPGPSGNCGISGHRTTYLAPFREIDRLGRGDVVRIETSWRRYTYRVTQRFFAYPQDNGVMLPTAAPTLTLTSCHPPYSDQFRIVVRAVLVKAERR
jgi:sortase A